MNIDSLIGAYGRYKIPFIPNVVANHGITLPIDLNSITKRINSIKFQRSIHVAKHENHIMDGGIIVGTWDGKRAADLQVTINRLLNEGVSIVNKNLPHRDQVPADIEFSTFCDCVIGCGADGNCLFEYYSEERNEYLDIIRPTEEVCKMVAGGVFPCFPIPESMFEDFGLQPFL